MIENLKIALIRQKKLLIIFFLTIFLPSMTLSIFGIRAIRNERFRLAEQVENEHREAANSIKTQINSQLDELETKLQNIAQNPALLNQDIPELTDLIKNRISDIPLAEHVFMAYDRGETLFPLFSPPHQSSRSLGEVPLSESQKDLLKRAEENEFKLKRYRSAITLYNQIFSRSNNYNIKAQMLSNIGRCYTKTKDFELAIKSYDRICESYSEATSSSGLPLCLIARLQVLHCYQNLDDNSVLLTQALSLYSDLLDNPWGLEENQFKTYSSMVNETMLESLSKTDEESANETLRDEYAELKIRHEKKIEEWAVIHSIREEIIPELNRRLAQQITSDQQPIRYLKNVKNNDYLFIVSAIQGEGSANPAGLLGVKLDNDYLIFEILSPIIEDLSLGANTNIVISDFSGEIFLREKKQAQEITTVTDYFSNNFPPWKIEIYHRGEENLGGFDIRKSFYFWTIVTLVLILAFGAALIIRTIANEMEVLKIKSDFVSSVSHELKTPLTSIKALVERLQEGKVKEMAKMQQYFSVISQDTDKLTNLVTNILDFSKIEEGKKEYNFEETDVSQWMTHYVEKMKKSDIQKGLAINCDIDPDLHSISLDRNSISQALNNLVDNAEKFSRNKKEIDISAKRENDSIVISVTDYGIGIPASEIDGIFAKFYQGKSALSQSVRGTGLGLTLVKHIVDAHGGKISVKSQVGEGSTFSLILPIEKKEG